MKKTSLRVKLEGFSIITIVIVLLVIVAIFICFFGLIGLVFFIGFLCLQKIVEYLKNFFNINSINLS